MRDDDLGDRDALGGAGAGLPDPAHADTAWADEPAPDDISALSRDIQLYRRECRAQRRHDRMQRFYARPGATPVTFTIAAVAVAAIVAMLLTLLAPSTATQTISALPLAHPATAAGQPGGLVPAVSLKTTGKPVNSQLLRPGVLAFTPNISQNASLLKSLAATTADDRVKFDVIAPTYPDTDADALSGQLPTKTSAIYYDPSGELTGQFPTSSTGVTLVLVDRNGTISTITPNVVSATTSNLKKSLLDMLIKPESNSSGSAS